MCPYFLRSAILVFAFSLQVSAATAAEPLFKNPAAGKPETWTYRSQEKPGEWLVMTDASSYTKGKDGRSLMIVVSRPRDKNFVTTMVMEPQTMKPVSITVRGETEIVAEAKYAGSLAEIEYRGLDKRKSKKIWLTVVTYDQRTLFWLLRGYPFNSPRELEIDLIMPLGNRCSMKLRYLGVEHITVPAGKFRAHKLELEPNAILPIFSDKLRTYFWYSTEKIPRFLKYAYPARNIRAELIK